MGSQDYHDYHCYHDHHCCHDYSACHDYHENHEYNQSFFVISHCTPCTQPIRPGRRREGSNHTTKLVLLSICKQFWFTPNSLTIMAVSLLEIVDDPKFVKFLETCKKMASLWKHQDNF